MWYDEDFTYYHEGFEIDKAGFSVVAKIQEGIIHMVDFGFNDVAPLYPKMSRGFIDTLMSFVPKEVANALPRYRGKNADLVYYFMNREGKWFEFNYHADRIDPVKGLDKYNMNDTEMIPWVGETLKRQKADHCPSCRALYLEKGKVECLPCKTIGPNHPHRMAEADKVE